MILFTDHCLHFMQIICGLYYSIAIFVLILTFNLQFLKNWALHGKNLLIKLDKSEIRNEEPMFHKLLNKVDQLLISKTYFIHFYLTGLIINSVLLCQNWVKGLTVKMSSTSFLFELHLLRRFLEQFYLVRTTSKSFMHIFSYFLGISFYIITPFALYKTDNAGHHIWTLVGHLSFWFGNIIQFDSHNRLAKLRPKKDSTNDANWYKIPVGGLFEFISCPHYFAELLIYISFLFLNVTLLSLLNLVMVFLIMVINALQSHRWYLEIFKDSYPKKRKSLIPFIF